MTTKSGFARPREILDPLFLYYNKAYGYHKVVTFLHNPLNMWSREVKW